MISSDILGSIFVEAAHRASLIPLASEATIYALKSFGQSGLELPVALAILGGLTGHAFNYALGRFMMRLPSSPKHHAVYQMLAKYFNRYGFVVLIIAPWAMFNILVLAAGMLGTPIKKTFPLIALGLAVYYGKLLIP